MKNLNTLSLLAVGAFALVAASAEHASIVYS